jgi:Leucine-rich repeat (LRR) protein
MQNRAFHRASELISKGIAEKYTTLDLSHLGLTHVPPEVFEMPWLEQLYLHCNNLTRLPNEIYQLSNLRLLDARSNKLPVIPSTIGRLSCLETLYLDSNRLVELPEEVGLLRLLRWLGLSDNNKLTTLPVFFRQSVRRCDD